MLISNFSDSTILLNMTRFLLVTNLFSSDLSRLKSPGERSVCVCLSRNFRISFMAKSFPWDFALILTYKILSLLFCLKNQQPAYTARKRIDVNLKLNKCLKESGHHFLFYHVFPIRRVNRTICQCFL